MQVLNTNGAITFSIDGTSGYSGCSGFSGQTLTLNSGMSGYSGMVGSSGFSGISGLGAGIFLKGPMRISGASESSGASYFKAPIPGYSMFVVSGNSYIINRDALYASGYSGWNSGWNNLDYNAQESLLEGPSGYANYPPNIDWTTDYWDPGNIGWNKDSLFVNQFMPGLVYMPMSNGWVKYSQLSLQREYNGTVSGIAGEILPTLEITPGSGMQGPSGFSGYIGKSGLSGFSGYSGDLTLTNAGVLKVDLSGISGASETSGFSSFKMPLPGYSCFVRNGQGYIFQRKLETSGFSAFDYPENNWADWSYYAQESLLEGPSGLATIAPEASGTTVGPYVDDGNIGWSKDAFPWDTFNMGPGAGVRLAYQPFSDGWLKLSYISPQTDQITWNGDSGCSGQAGTIYPILSVSNEYGLSGFSGINGINGIDGKSGFSGFDAQAGYSGPSGFSGMEGASGLSGMEGPSGFSGYSGSGGGTATEASYYSYPSGFSCVGVSGYFLPSQCSGISHLCISGQRYMVEGQLVLQILFYGDIPFIYFDFVGPNQMPGYGTLQFDPTSHPYGEMYSWCVIHTSPNNPGEGPLLTTIIYTDPYSRGDAGCIGFKGMLLSDVDGWLYPEIYGADVEFSNQTITQLNSRNAHSWYSIKEILNEQIGG